MHTLIFANAMLFLSTLSLRRATRGWTLFVNGAVFLSTLSLRRATGSVNGISSKTVISIHALLAESDHLGPQIIADRVSNFYPRSPCGERQTGPCTDLRGPRFLSTLSLRRATQLTGSRRPETLFLSTLSLRRATV